MLSVLLSMVNAVKVALTGAFSGVGRMSTYVLMVSAKEASELLRRCWYDRQRPINNTKVVRFLKTIVDGTFVHGVTVTMIKFKDKLTILDGHHKLLAIARCNTSVAINFIVHECKTIQQVHRVYALFDTVGGVRKASDAYIAAYGMDDVDRVGGRQNLNKLVSAMGFVQCSFSGTYERVTRSDTDGKCELAHLFVDEAKTFYSVLKESLAGLRPGTLTKPEFLSVFLVAMKWQRKKAIEFVTAVAGRGVDKANDPCLALREYLFRLELTGERNALNQRKSKVTPHMRSMMVAHCFNHHLEGKSLARLVPEEACGDHIVILGTPFKYAPQSAPYIKALSKYGIAGARTDIDKLLSMSKTSRGCGRDVALRELKADVAGKPRMVTASAARKVAKPAKPKAYGKGNRVPQDTLAAMQDFRASGATIREVQEKFGVSYATVSRHTHA